MDIQGIEHLYQSAQSDISAKAEEERRAKVAEQEKFDEFRQELTQVIEQIVQDSSAAERYALATAVWERPSNVILGSRGPCSQRDSVMARMRILFSAARLGHKEALKQTIYLMGNINYAVCLTESERKFIEVSAWIWAALRQSAPADDATIQAEAKCIIVWLEKGAAKKDPDSMFALAEACFLGRGVERDVQMSYRLHTIAAALGHSDSRARSVSIAKAYGIADIERTLPDNLTHTKLIAAVPDPSPFKQVAAPHSVLSGRYIDNRDGTVTDMTTGLMWMRFASGQTWDGTTCIGDATKVSWDVASRLRRDFAGFGDWRLPSIEELKTLVDSYREEPAIYDLIFPKTPRSVFLSDTAYAGYPAFTWGVNFEHGHVEDHHREYANCHVRLVRSVAVSKNDDEPEERPARIAATVSSKPISIARRMPIVAEPDSLDRAEEIIKRLEALESTFISALGRMESLLEHLRLNQTAVRAVGDRMGWDPALNATDVGELHRRLTNAVQVERLKRAASDAIQGPAASVTYTSLPQFLHGLIELKDISLVELRRHLLPLDLLPSAVIEQINEKAFDLVGEAALEEDGDRVVVYREVLVRELETWDTLSAKVID